MNWLQSLPCLSKINVAAVIAFHCLERRLSAIDSLATAR